MYCWYKAKLRGLAWSLLCSSIVLILCQIDYVYAIRKGRLMVPNSYTALTGDLHIQFQYSEATSESLADLSFEISRLRNNEKEKLETISLHPDPRLNVSQIKLPCHIFFRGGIYELEVVGSSSSSSSINSTVKDQKDERLRQQLDVRWPTPKLSVTPELIGTYPEGPVDVVLSFPEVECEVENLNDAEIPEFWLELIYCGQEVLCTSSNGTKSHVLYAEQIRGFPRTRLVKLRCELFGLAGHYAIQLRPLQPTPSFVSAISYIRADWNEKFVFNVHARSIFPCDPHTGIGVLFEYPACILDQADRVRLFAKLRADVASLKPPTSLHYVTEQRVMRGQHSLHFDCDFFSEKYVEYCFVYVSQAISGAVADIRMDCVPTLPVSDADTGGWGPWSDWTPCSTTCSGGTRNRYRFCDSPPPRYGAKFCEGPAVQTEHCGTESSDTWECLYGPGMLKTSRTTMDKNDVVTEIGPGCRCGCIVHLGTSKPQRVLASSAQSCPGRSFWLIQADGNYRIHLKVDFFRLPCSTQYVKIRDGDSLASNLISENVGNAKIRLESVLSTGSQILVEFFSDEIASMDGSCNGGFLAHVEQIENHNVTFITSRAITQKPQIGKRITIVHIAAVVFASIIIIISALLGAQYILRYRKYHLTANRCEPDSPIHTPRASLGSLQNPGSPPSRAMSTTTLLSEVIYLVKIRPRGRMKHSILRESVDAEALVKETGLNDDEIERLKCVDSESIGSVHTLTNEIVNDNNSNINEKDPAVTAASSSCCSPTNDNESIHSRQSIHSLNCNSSIDTPLSRRKLRTDKSNRLSTDTTKSSLLNDVKEDATEMKPVRLQRRFLSISNATLTNGCYSPAASIISTATIRTTNQKESKDKQNRQKLLARPDSEFSLANPEELELDYYDYNVVNAGAAPGSYLGMDPAYLVWIPPLDDGNIISEMDKNSNEPHYEEILPMYNCIDPGSNTETPEDEAPEPPPMNFKRQQIDIQECDENMTKHSLIQKTLVAALLKEDSPKLNSRRSSNASSDKSLRHNAVCTTDNIQLTELSGKIKKFSPKTHVRNDSSDIEKETAVVKSPSDLQEYYELEDIQFADEDDSNESDNSKSKSRTIKYNHGYQVRI